MSFVPDQMKIELIAEYMRTRGAAGMDPESVIRPLAPTMAEAPLIVGVAQLHVESERAYYLLLRRLSVLRQEERLKSLHDQFVKLYSSGGGLIDDLDILRVNLGLVPAHTGRGPDSGGGLPPDEPPPTWDNIIKALEEGE